MRRGPLPEGWRGTTRCAWSGLLLLAAVGLLAWPAAAHRLAPSLLELQEQGGGAVRVRWKTPRLQPTGSALHPELPSRCSEVGTPRAASDARSLSLEWRVRCGEGGLVGARIAVRGLSESATNALLSVALEDGRRFRAVLHGERSSLVIPERQSAWRVARDYLGLGMGHILAGLDHLLFVLGLLLLVTGARRLLYTVTSFTLGHSVTLSLAALGVFRFPPTPIELAIAVTILVLAVELARGRSAPESRMRRAPWSMAFLFGLLHGLGFAGALAEIGLPQEEIPLALLSFNLGIEAGQLVFIAVALASRRALDPVLVRSPAWLARAPAYGIGTLAVYWCLDRAVALG